MVLREYSELRQEVTGEQREMHNNIIITCILQILGWLSQGG